MTEMAFGVPIPKFTEMGCTIPPAYTRDAVDFFNRAAIAGSPIPFFEKSCYNNVILNLKNTLSRSGNTSLWDEIDVLNIHAVSKTVALLNLRGNYHNGIIVNDYATSWDDNTGFTGNSSNFYIKSGYNPGDTFGGHKFIQNSACLFMLNTSTALSTNYSIGSTNFASTTGSIITAGRGATRVPFLDLNISSFGSSADSGLNIAYNKCWVGIERNGSAGQKRTVNGISILSDTHTSTTIPNFEFTLFARNKGGTIQDFSNHSCYCWVAGSKQINEFKVQSIIEQYFLKPRGLTNWMPNRLITMGDSMTASGVNGNNCRWTNTVAASLGNTWQVHADGLAGGTITTNIEPLSVTNIDPYRKTYCSRDIVAFLAGTNDLANSSGVTGTTLYNDYKTWVANRTTNGFSSFILIGMMDRDATFSGGQTQAGFDTGRSSFRTLMLADFTTSTSVTNVFTSSVSGWEGCVYVDLGADSKYTDASNATYFSADGIHPTTTLDDDLANTYIIPIINANLI